MCGILKYKYVRHIVCMIMSFSISIQIDLLEW